MPKHPPSHGPRHGGPPGGPRRRRGGPGRRARCRWWDDEDEQWVVLARIERYVEPALLLILRDGSAHGYDLGEALEELVGERVDLGNLYRMLRKLEEDGVVSSTWRDDLPGRAKRDYQLTERGVALLDTWMSALDGALERITDLKERYETPPPTSSPQETPSP